MQVDTSLHNSRFDYDIYLILLHVISVPTLHTSVWIVWQVYICAVQQWRHGKLEMIHSWALTCNTGGHSLSPLPGPQDAGGQTFLMHY